ncbi:MAG: hypothetical protein KC910_24560 [Candidatus Eremiobacteraeota bacterium]|nr:hypothetical protein [Candidatus Eremiobacteraeota bacterium]
MNENLQKFIEQQKLRGALDSSGHFSVNPFKARAKMAQFQTGDPAFYLLRLVQAGVLARARRLEFQLMYTGIECVMVEPDFELLPSNQVLAGFGTPLAKGSRTAISFLVHGLNVLLGNPPESIELSWNRADGISHKVSVSEAGILQTESRHGLSYDWFGLTVKRQSSRKQVACETQALYNRAGCAPIVVLCDGTPVNSGSNAHSSLYSGSYPCDWNGYLPDHYLLAERYLGGGDSSGICLAAPSLRLAQFWEAQGKKKEGSAKRDIFLHQSPPDLPDDRLTVADGVITIPISLVQPSTITYVQAGVVIETEKLTTSGVHVIYCVDGYETDLSGCQLVRDEHYAKLKRFLVDEMHGLAHEVRSRLRYIKARFDWTTERKQTAAAMAGILACYVFSGWSLWTIPVLGKLWAGALATVGSGGSGLALQAKANLDEEFREHLRERLPL